MALIIPKELRKSLIIPKELRKSLKVKKGDTFQALTNGRQLCVGANWPR
jgi:bifunctional DNA-binding transcriptional regulator/antitoxin component of YhaV-PrlF toxin-antitoxin module